MARMPATLRPAHAPKREEQKRVYWQRSDAQRLSAFRRGYDRHWSKSRKGFLIKHPLCCCCEANGQVSATTFLDHIVPHKGDKALFWDRTNWQGLCDDCNLRIKAIMEHRYLRGLLEAKDLNLARPMPEFFSSVWGSAANGGDDLWHPCWMRCAKAQTIVVCGPAASGKNTYVAQRVAPQDTVIDLDAIGMRLSGVRSKAWPSEYVIRAVEERNRMLYGLGADSAKGRAWFIVSEPDGTWRQWWHDVLKPFAIVVIATPADECMRRAEADPARLSLLPKHAELIEQWWQRYTPRDGDRIIA